MPQVQYSLLCCAAVARERALLRDLNAGHGSGGSAAVRDQNLVQLFCLAPLHDSDICLTLGEASNLNQKIRASKVIEEKHAANAMGTSNHRVSWRN